MMSGQAELAHHIADVANYAYVPQMTFPELDDWAAEAGLTHEELALIQPGYYFTLTDSFLLMAIAIWTAGVLILWGNAVYLVRRRNGVVVPIIGIIFAIILLLLGIVCFDSMLRAYHLGTHPDGFPYDRPLRDVAPLALGAAISLIVAFATGGLSIYRMWYFNRDR
jgi:hypothetical protein